MIPVQIAPTVASTKKAFERVLLTRGGKGDILKFHWAVPMQASRKCHAFRISGGGAVLDADTAQKREGFSIMTKGALDFFTTFDLTDPGTFWYWVIPASFFLWVLRML
jgi:hypothetical protein